MSNSFVLVIGGAASGKSAFAEQQVLQSGLNRTYLATSRIWDAEMESKVGRHKAMRGAGWNTIEEPLYPQTALAKLGPEDAALLDCATMWLSNHLMEKTDIDTEQTALIRGLTQCAAKCVVVTNEVGHGIVPENSLARRFRDMQGRLNQALAAEAQTVVLVTAGLPQVLKGHLE